MSIDGDIARLDEQLRLLWKQPGKKGVLRTTPTAFQFCTREHWIARRWDAIRDDEVARIGSGDPEQKSAGLLSLLEPFNVRDVVIVGGIGIIEVVPDP
jgi:hypothetical protein